MLRDGAAAQYGSDAIAGVLNFQLEAAASGGAIEYSTGIGSVTPGNAGRYAVMQTTRSISRGFCFLPEVIAHAVFLYHRFPLSLRDVEDRRAQRGIAVGASVIKCW